MTLIYQGVRHSFPMCSNGCGMFHQLSSWCILLYMKLETKNEIGEKLLGMSMLQAAVMKKLLQLSVRIWL